MSPLVLGVTGCVGAGKSTVCAELAKQGWAPLDVDEVVRAVLVERRLDPRALLAATTSDPAAFGRWVEEVGPEVLRRVQAWIAALDGAGVIEAALLFEVGLDPVCDLTLCVRCSAPQRRRRVEARSSASAGMFDAIEAAQWSEARKAECADAELESGGSIEEALRRAERRWLLRRWNDEALCDRYEEPHRRYHSLSHLVACLRELDAAPLDETDKAVLTQAIVYHDAIYEPFAVDKRSAALAEQVVGERVAALVRATKHHAATEDPLSAWLNDIDLSILAARRRDFEAYERGIRAEYATVPEATYRERRAEVLSGFLERERIYLTSWGQARYEAKAQKNLRHRPMPDARRPTPDL